MSVIWKVDPHHSEVQFKVKHLVISTVTGQFNAFDGTIEAPSEQGFTNAKVNFSVDAASVDTHMKDRDEHLRSPDFFDATTYPVLSFTSTAFNKKDEDTYELIGNLQIKEHTEQVTFHVDLGGVAQDAYGNLKAGFEVRGKISRKAFGLKWNSVTEAGAVVVGDEVKMMLNLQFIKQ